MKIVYNNGYIHFMDVYGKNYVIDEGWEGIETEDTILIMSQRIHEGRAAEFMKNQQNNMKSLEEE